jgi:hypothetical protein
LSPAYTANNVLSSSALLLNTAIEANFFSNIITVVLQAALAVSVNQAIANTVTPAKAGTGWFVFEL